MGSHWNRHVALGPDENSLVVTMAEKGEGESNPARRNDKARHIEIRHGDRPATITYWTTVAGLSLSGIQLDPNTPTKGGFGAVRNPDGTRVTVTDDGSADRDYGYSLVGWLTADGTTRVICSTDPQVHNDGPPIWP
jgi:hypothetical protein